MTDLALKTSDKARIICMSVAEPDNGFECWRLLCKRGQGGGAALKVGLLNQILQFDFKGDFGDRILVLEGLVRSYEKGLTDGSELDTAVKVATIVNGSTGKLRDQLVARQFATYDLLHGFIDEYFDNQRAFVAPQYNTKKDTTSGGGDDMEVDAFFKGKGKARVKMEKANPRPKTEKAKVRRASRKASRLRRHLRAIVIVAASTVTRRAIVGIPDPAQVNQKKLTARTRRRGSIGKNQHRQQHNHQRGQQPKLQQPKPAQPAQARAVAWTL